MKKIKLYFSLLPAMNGTSVSTEDEFGWWAHKRLVYGPKIKSTEWPKGVKFVRYKGTRLLSDAPACVFSGIHLVSGRLKEFCEAEAPGAFNYWPVKIVERRRRPGEFWAIERVLKYKCLHESAFVTGDNGKPDPLFPIIDHAKLPEDALIGTVKEWPLYTFIRSDLIAKMKAAGIRGPMFNNLPQVLPETPVKTPKQKTPVAKGRLSGKKSK